MLKLKYLNGNLAGKFLALKEGDNFVGRLSESDVAIDSLGVSKKHAKLTIQGSQCFITDLGSSNGTFVNGAKITDRILRAGDRIAFHNIIFELIAEIPPAPAHEVASPWNSNLAFQQAIPQELPPIPGGPQMQMGKHSAPVPENFLGFAQSYMNKVILPGIFKLTELYPVKSIIGLFTLLFILILTALSTVPMIEMTKSGIQKESQRRALTLAKQLANSSEKAISAGSEATIRTDSIESEDGVTLAVVVAREDGHIIAPLTKAQSYSNEEFVARGRKHDEIFIEQINDTTIGVSVPIRSFSAEAGQQVITAFAQIIYKMDSFRWNESIGLFARVLIIGLLLGLVFYTLLYQIVAHPIEDAAHQVDLALRGEKDTVTSKYDFEILKKLINNINGALGRMSQSGQEQQFTIDRSSEASNLVRIISDPAFALDGSGNFIQVNPTFEDLTGMRLLTLQGQSLEILQDQALKLNIEDLSNRAKSQPGSVISSQIEISGINYDMDVQASSEGPLIGYVLGILKKRGFG